MSANDSEVARLCEEMEESEDALVDTPATTIGGLLEKVKACRWHTRNHKGGAAARHVHVRNRHAVR
jgi:hypothetical protein